jgi:hypothetical protein
VGSRDREEAVSILHGSVSTVAVQEWNVREVGPSPFFRPLGRRRGARVDFDQPAPAVDVLLTY